MTRFQFRLAQIERLRQAEEAMEKRVLQERLTALMQAESTLAEARNRLSDYSKRLSARGQQPVPANLLANYRQWYNWLLDRVHAQAEVVSQRQADVDEQRERVRRARLQTRTLEQLRDKQVAEHRQSSAQDEQKQLDDLALQRGPARMGDRR